MASRLKASTPTYGSIPRARRASAFMKCGKWRKESWTGCNNGRSSSFLARNRPSEAPNHCRSSRNCCELSAPPERGVLPRSAFAPKQIGRQANQQQHDRGSEILKLRRIVEREVDGVADDSCGGEDEQNRRPGISGDAVRDGLAAIGAANGKYRRRSESVKNPANEDNAFNQFLERAQFAGTDQHRGPDP